MNWCSSFFNYLKDHMSVEVMIYLAVAILLVILISMISRTMKGRKVHKRLMSLEEDVNELDDGNLNVKYKKAVSFARTNDDIYEKVKQLKPKYEICRKSVKACHSLYESASSLYDRHRYKKAMKAMDELETSITDTEERVRIVSTSLDRILSKEDEILKEADQVKAQFNQAKESYENNRADFHNSYSFMDEQFAGVQGQINLFDELMSQSEFNKAKEEIDRISHRTEDLGRLVEMYPPMYKKAVIILPAALAEVKEQIEKVKESKIDLSYLDTDAKLSAIENAINDATIRLDNGNAVGTDMLLDSIGDQILMLQEDISSESKAFEEIHGDLEANFAVLEQVEEELDEIITLYANIKDRFGLEDWTRRFKSAQSELDRLKVQRDDIRAKLENDDVLRVDVVHQYRNFATSTIEFGKQVKEMQRLLMGASSDESRAKKQLIKLQLILNEVRLNTAMKNLPSISDQFDEDLKTGQKKIQEVRNILDTTPLNVDELNVKLQDAIDFVYRLYNDANNLTGVAVMAENAIVFGNRFRSTYPTLDSELTRAELYFQNGEYTLSLKTAIQAIESVHPGIYEKLVAKKDPAVMNLGA